MRLVDLPVIYRETKRARRKKTKRDIELDRIYEEVQSRKKPESQHSNHN